jgi:hypothetical protein
MATNTEQSLINQANTIIIGKDNEIERLKTLLEIQENEIKAIINAGEFCLYENSDISNLIIIKNLKIEMVSLRRNHKLLIVCFMMLFLLVIILFYLLLQYF